MVNVDVYVPAVDCSYEFMLDEKALVEGVMKEMLDILQKKFGGTEIQTTEQFSLYTYENNSRLCLNDSLEHQYVKNGSRLLLV